MSTIRHFLLIGEAVNHHIQCGDQVEIKDAFLSSDPQIALAHNISINGKPHRFRIPSSFARKLKPTGPVHGEIVDISRSGKDLLIAISTKEQENPVKTKHQKNSLLH